MPRKLRIAVSAFFGLLTIALCLLWVRSYTWHDALVRFAPNQQVIASQNGDIVFLNDLDTWSKRETGWSFRSRRGDESDGEWMGLRVSHLYFTAFFCLVAVVAFPYSLRFSLRTLLIATTLLAIVLGLGIWLTRYTFLPAAPLPPFPSVQTVFFCAFSCLFVAIPNLSTPAEN